MPVNMGARIKCFGVIFSVLFQVIFGCSYDNINCTIHAYCSGADYISFRYVRNNFITDGCSNLINYSSYYYIPMQIYLTGSINVYEKLPQYDESVILHALIALHITNLNLVITPTLNAMDNLKMLNLSNNNLRVADLFNEEELIQLQDIDLSYNIITSIQVDENQYVYKKLRKINLSHNILNNISGGIFASFKYLEFLDLSYNNLAVIDHYTFEGLKNLKYLYMSHNSIIDLNSSLFRFVYLKELYLDNNKIEKILSRDFETLEQLQDLNLDFNKISRIEKDTFNGTVSLITVKLHHNLLNYIHKDAFILTNKLEALDISYNLLKALPRDMFKNKFISSFSITGNNLEGALSRGIFEGIHVTEFDISFQEITTVEDYAFFGLEQLTVLLLNNNKIHTILKHAFDTLKYLNHLDLSNNYITNLDFDTTDLLSLQTYYLGKNFIEQIRHDDFRYLKKLQFLDLSNNNITNLEPSSFKSAENLENFQIFHNPLKGILLKNTFDGLSLVPILDLSCTLLTTIQNGSFSGMVQVQDLNISRSSINVLEYNAFMNTGNLKLIDLSYNKLSEFSVNTSDIRNLTTIFLNNNNLLYISNNCFKDMSLLNKVVISHNYLKELEHEVFINQIDLNYLDVSYNINLTFHISAIKNLSNLDILILSSTKSEIDFTNIGKLCVKHLEISHLFIYNVSQMHLNTMRYLTGLVLSNNNIVKIDLNNFKNLSVLESLDLSFNNISSIQPGSFKDNVLLQKLNLSHNFITNLNYGIFRGLVSLEILDVSFNNVRDLKRERFYDLPNLGTLIIDNNKITDVDNDFFDINLSLLSIGNNPLPCEKLVQMKKRLETNIVISAINIDEHNNDNIDGIICNKYNNVPEVKVNTNDFKADGKILTSIKEILLNISTTNQVMKSPSDSRISTLLKNILDKMSNNTNDQIRGEIQLKNITSQLSHLTQVTDKVDKTNLFLERILNAVLGFGSLLQSKSVLPTNNITKNKINASFLESDSKLNDIISDISQVKHELLYLENAISEIDRKMSVDRTITKPLVSDRVNASALTVDRSTGKSFVFIEVCVSLILLILISFILYKIYLSKIFSLNTRSLSTRHITDAMDNSNL